MTIKLGEKIKALRKQKNISQEMLAQYLGVSFQAISKWENALTMPDVALIPAIASFFGVSTDELFDFNRLEQEKRIEEIVAASAPLRSTDPARSEAIIREGLKQYPGNDVLLNCLLYVMDGPERREEVLTLCRTLLETTRDDAVKYDVCRILAETYKDMGEYELCRQTLEQIPEIYFTKLELQALLLDGEDMFEPAWRQRDLSAEMLVDMLLRMADYYQAKASPAADAMRTAARRVILALKDLPRVESGQKTFYETYGKKVLARLDAQP